MTTPHFDSVRDIPLLTDHDIVERLDTMLAGAVRRQGWLMFLDDDARQLPVLMPSALPPRPRKTDSKVLASLIGALAEDIDAEAVVVTYERRGATDLTNADKVWLRSLRDACIASSVSFRGPFLCHNDGVSQVAPDDYLS